MRPSSNDASFSNAAGEKSRSQGAQPTQRSTAMTSTDLPLSKVIRTVSQAVNPSSPILMNHLQVARIMRLQRGLLFGLPPL